MSATASQPPETNYSAAQQQSAARSRRNEHTRAITFTGALRLILPALVVAVVLILGAAVYYVRWGFNDAEWHGRRQAVPVWIAFNDIGRIMSRRVGDSADAVPVSGYDGQFYYYLARDPGIMVVCAHSQVRCPIDANPLREERVLYPLTARVVALNNPDWLHVSLVLVNFAAILVTVLLVGQLCVEAGASRWLGMVVGIFCGELLGLLRDLADPYAAMWVVLAVYLLRKNRPLWGAAAVGAALLTREQLVLVLPLLALPLVAQRRWRTLALAALIAFTPFVAWQVTLYGIFHRWGIKASLATTHGVTYPFHGLWQYHNGPEFGVEVAFVAVPLLFTIVLSLAWLCRHGVRALLTDPVPLVALTYSLLLTLTAYSEWAGMFNSARLVTPAAALGVLVACGLAPRLRRSYVAVLCATALAPLLMLPALY
ncbi:MAG TPA: hypothetical protein VF120_01860 [Ktedonobacterales bacterium]